MKKLVFVMAICAAFSTYAQNGITAVLNVDEFTGKKTAESSIVSFRGSGISISMNMNKTIESKSGNPFTWISAAVSSGETLCVTKGKTTLSVKLQDGTIIEMMMIGNTDCGQITSMSFIPVSAEQARDPDSTEIWEKNMMLLKSQPWTMMRLRDADLKAYDFKPAKPKKKFQSPSTYFVDAITAIEAVW